MDHNQPLTEISNMLFLAKEVLIAFLPKLILALFVFFIGFLVARFVEFLVKRFMNYLGRVMDERFHDQVRHINIGTSTAFFGKALFWIILVFFSILSAEILGFTIITTWLGSILRYSPNILAAIFIVFAGIIIGRVLSEMIATATEQVGIGRGNVLGKIVQYTIVITSIIIAVDQVGIDIVFLTQLVGIILAALLFGAALAFGLGAKTSVSNILASFYVNKIYKEGDYVRIKDIEGTITKIDSTTVLVDTKQGQVTIPAKEFNETTSILIKK